MQITRRSPLTGLYNTREINVTQEQLDRFARREAFIQDIMPNVPPADREFIKTGFTPEDWDAMFPDE